MCPCEDRDSARRPNPMTILPRALGTRYLFLPTALLARLHRGTRDLCADLFTLVLSLRSGNLGTRRRKLGAGLCALRSVHEILSWQIESLHRSLFRDSTDRFCVGDVIDSPSFLRGIVHLEEKCFNPEERSYLPLSKPVVVNMRCLALPPQTY